MSYKSIGTLLATCGVLITSFSLFAKPSNQLLFSTLGLGMCIVGVFFYAKKEKGKQQESTEG